MDHVNRARALPRGRFLAMPRVNAGELDSPGTVYGTARGAPATERMSRQAAWYAAHRSDRPAG
jgi:hypothetical protein